MGREDGRKADKNSTRIGVLLYREDDTSIGILCTGLEDKIKEYEQETGIKVKLDTMNTKGSQNTQNSQMEHFISLGCDALCINSVGCSSVSITIDRAMDVETPVIFFNWEPVEEDMNRWGKLYYVEAGAKESAVFQGDILADICNQGTRTLDASGNGPIGYMPLERETSHQDSLVRMEWSIQTLKDGGVPLERITGGIANWDRSQASALMEQWLKEYSGQIKLVVSNNDDMALRAIDTVNRAGAGANSVKVAGVGGIPVGIKILEEKYLFNTVESNKERYSQAVFDIVQSLSLGRDPKDRVSQLEGNYYWCLQRVLTQIEAKLLENQWFILEAPMKRDKIGEIL